jgi:selenocysteine lyase/cysteine desulfurase
MFDGRYLTNWVINSLLKLQHPEQIEGQGTPLVHIYGPGVQFDRGASVTFNIFDRSGVLVQPSLVQRLADRSNISLGLGKLCNIIYPEGLQDLWVYSGFSTHHFAFSISYTNVKVEENHLADFVLMLLEVPRNL